MSKSKQPPLVQACLRLPAPQLAALKQEALRRGLLEGRATNWAALVRQLISRHLEEVTK